MNTTHRNAGIAAIGFLVSLLLTWWFIESFDGYLSFRNRILSGSIAGGKWALQLLLAFLLLGDKRWLYFREMGVVCATGSLLLLPYILLGNSWYFFLGSLICSVIAMAVMVVLRLTAIQVGKNWILLWFGLLAIAVTLQLTVVFKVIP